MSVTRKPLPAVCADLRLCAGNRRIAKQERKRAVNVCCAAETRVKVAKTRFCCRRLNRPNSRILSATGHQLRKLVVQSAKEIDRESGAWYKLQRQIWYRIKRTRSPCSENPARRRERLRRKCATAVQQPGCEAKTCVDGNDAETERILTVLLDGRGCFGLLLLDYRVPD